MTPRVVCALLFVALAAPAAMAQGRQLAVIVRIDGSDVVQAVNDELDLLTPPWPHLQVGTVFDDGLVQVWVIPRLTRPQGVELFRVADRLKDRVPAVLAAGELVATPGPLVRIYSGLVSVHLSRPADRRRVENWVGSRPGWAIDPTRTRRLHMLLRAPPGATQLGRVLPQVPSPGGPAELVFFDFGAPSLTDSEIGDYHRVPSGRDELAVILQPGVARSNYRSILDAGFAVDHSGEDRQNEVHLAKFVSKEDRRKGMLLLQAGSNANIVRFAGPAIRRRGTLGVVTAELIVGFVDAGARYQARPILQAYNLVKVREIPYIDHGYVFQRVDEQNHPEASYELYDAGRALLDARYASLAVPNVITKNEYLFGVLDCTPGSNQQYFAPIRLGEAWIAAGSARNTVIGLLDLGFTNGPPQDQELNVAAMLDSKYCTTDCTFGVTGFVTPLCVPEIPTSWVDSCPSGPRNMITSVHSQMLGLIAAAKITATEGDCENYIGVAPGAMLIDVGQTEVSEDWEVASAAWWMAGGNPRDCDYYPEVLENNQAAVINMSFSRSYGGADDCGPSATNLLPPPGTTCEAICGLNVDCSLIESVLRKLRNGEGAVDWEEGDACAGAGTIRDKGVLVVTAVPHYGGESDLHTSVYTTAVGTVDYETLGPKNSSDACYVETCLEQPTGPCVDDPARSCSIDLVVPMGGNASIVLETNLKGGHTSAAAAVVSGVAALMFDVNSELTAAQADCILKETARELPDERWADLAEWGCEFIDGRSPCFGHGMLDAAGAVEAAQACIADPSACLCDSAGTPPPVPSTPPETPAGLRIDTG